MLPVFEAYIYGRLNLLLKSDIEIIIIYITVAMGCHTVHALISFFSFFFSVLLIVCLDKLVLVLFV